LIPGPEPRAAVVREQLAGAVKPVIRRLSGETPTRSIARSSNCALQGHLKLCM
jgi:hypothetical protein